MYRVNQRAIQSLGVVQCVHFKK